MQHKVDSFEEFRSEITKQRSKKTAKVNNSWGIYDIYKHIRRNKWYDIGRPLTEHEFYYIIRNVNRHLAENIANGKPVKFPAAMGKLELRKHGTGVSIVGGKLRNRYPIDWMETLRLWYEDEEEKDKKTLVRREVPEVFYVKYDKEDATYENKIFYQFVLNRFIKRKLSGNIREGKVDTLWYMK